MSMGVGDRDYEADGGLLVRRVAVTGKTCGSTLIRPVFAGRLKCRATCLGRAALADGRGAVPVTHA